MTWRRILRSRAFSGVLRVCESGQYSTVRKYAHRRTVGQADDGRRDERRSRCNRRSDQLSSTGECRKRCALFLRNNFRFSDPTWHLRHRRYPDSTNYDQSDAVWPCFPMKKWIRRADIWFRRGFILKWMQICVPKKKILKRMQICIPKKNILKRMQIVFRKRIFWKECRFVFRKECKFAFRKECNRFIPYSEKNAKAYSEKA